MKFRKMLFCLVLVLALTAALLPASAVDLEQTGRLTIECMHEQKPIVGVPFDLYYVGALDANRIVPTAEFSLFNLNLHRQDLETVNRLALTLQAYVAIQQLQPRYSGETDETGCYRIEDMEQGLYLVIGSTTVQGDYTFSCTPFFVAIPRLDPTSLDLIFDQTVRPKFNVQSTTTPGSVTRKVLKVWDDKGYESERPKSITVRLFCNGKEYDSVKLSDENNWRYTWEGLDEKYDWLVAEDLIPKYTMQMEKEGITFVLTNSRKPDSTDPTDPTDPTNPSTDPTEPSTDPTEPSTDPTSPTKPDDNKDLPYTGQYWWPVLAFGFGGVVCIIGALLCEKRKKHEE